MKGLIRVLARTIIPFRVRLEVVRLRRLSRFLVERRSVARRRAGESEMAGFGYLLAAHSSPLERVPGTLGAGVQNGKETNVKLAAGLLDGLVVGPNQIFSHHHTIGRTTRRRGFRKGLELRNGETETSVGGGLCQVSNSF